MWKQIIAPAALISVLWIAVSVPTTYYLNWLFESNAESMSENVRTIESAWTMRRDVWRLQVAVLEGMLEDARNVHAEIRQIEASFRAALADARRTSPTPEELNLVTRIEQRYGDYRSYVNSLLLRAAVEGPQLPPAAEREHIQKLAMAVTQECRELLTLNEELVRQQHARNERLYSAVVVARLGFLVIAPAVGLMLGWWVARRLNQSISQISVNLMDASGGLGPELGSVAVSTTDNLPALEHQVHRVADRIRSVVGELEQTRQRALQAERLAAVGELAAGVAHEVRNPLTSVKLLIQTASQREPSQPLNGRQLEVVLQEISRIETMIQGLLDFARPPRLRVVEHDLRQTLRRALTLLQGRAEHQHVTVEPHLPDAPVMVRADPDQLHLVFGNLAINAIEAMPRGGTLHVSIETGDEACRVIFADSGSGISNEIIDRIFEPFVSTRERGTGLGLAISHRIMQEHGGSIQAANRPDGGASLTVELKICPASADTSENPGPARPAVVGV